MGKLIVDIEVGSNGGFVLTWYKSNPTSLQKFAGIKQETERLAFSNEIELAKWIKTNGGK